MYQDARNTIQVVRIDTVDIDSNEVHCSGKDGGRFVLKIPISNGFYRIPKTGEYWIVRRQDSTNWYFEGVVARTDLYGSAYPKEGDIVVAAAASVNISGDHVFINNLPIGVVSHEEFDFSEQMTEIVLNGTPIMDTVQVFNNGLLIPPSKIIIREQTLLFSESLSIGKVVVYYSRVPVK